MTERRLALGDEAAGRQDTMKEGGGVGGGGEGGECSVGLLSVEGCGRGGEGGVSPAGLTPVSWPHPLRRRLQEQLPLWSMSCSGCQ